MTTKKDGYLGNPNLKQAGKKHEFTKKQVEEYIKCSKDPVYFIRTYIKVVSLDEGLVPFNLYDYQENMVNTIHNNRFVIAKLPRQSGKSTTIISYLLHYVLFNQNMSIAVLANKQTTARDILGRLKLAYEYLPLWLQQGIVEWNKGSIELENGSKIMASSTSASAIRGGSYNAIFLDEYGHVPAGVAEEFFSSVYPTITSGQSTKVMMVSTPHGLNMFYNFWKNANRKEGEEGKNEYIPIEVHWSQVPLYPGGPHRDEAWKEQQIKNTSEKQFASEFECDFVGSSNTLINTSKLKALSWTRPIEKSNDGLTVYEKPKDGHKYFMTVDTSRGLGKDFSAFILIDCTEMPYKPVVVYRNNIIAPMVFPTIIHAVAKRYNAAYCLIELNDIGSQVADILHADLEYDHIMMTTSLGRSGQVINGGFGGKGKSALGVKMTSPIKKVGCSVLKSFVEEDKLIIEDTDIIQELTTFVAKRQSFEADDGHTDDLAMCLVIFAWMTRQTYFQELLETNIRTKIYKEEIENVEEELSAFGFISNVDGVEEVDGVWDGEDRWFSDKKSDIGGL